METDPVGATVVLVVPGSWQFIAQHRRAAEVTGESSCASAALQQSIMSSFIPACIGTPAVTPPLSAANRTKDVNHFLIANADCTYAPEWLSSD